MNKMKIFRATSLLVILLSAFGCGGSSGSNEQFQLGVYVGDTSFSALERATTGRCGELTSILPAQHLLRITEFTDDSGVTVNVFARLFSSSHGIFSTPLAEADLDTNRVSFSEEILNPESPTIVSDENGTTECFIGEHETTLRPDNGNVLVNSDFEFSCTHDGVEFSCKAMEHGVLVKHDDGPIF